MKVGESCFRSFFGLLISRALAIFPLASCTNIRRIRKIQLKE